MRIAVITRVSTPFFSRMSCRAIRMEELAEPYIRRSEEHTSELQSQSNLVCRLLLEKKNDIDSPPAPAPRPSATSQRPADSPPPTPPIPAPNSHSRPANRRPTVSARFLCSQRSPDSL